MKDKKKIFFLGIGILIVSLIITILFSTGVFDNLSLNQEARALLSDAVVKCIEDKRDGIAHTSEYIINDGKSFPELATSVSEKLKGSIIVSSKCQAQVYWYKENEHSECFLTDEKLEIGSTFMCGTDAFNVLEFSDDTITLLSKYNINVNTYRQDKLDNEISSSNAISFDEVQNRTSTNNTYCIDYHYGCNVYSKTDQTITNGLITGTVSEDASIKYYVDNYAMKLKLGDNLISSSLITKEQLESLGCSVDELSCKNSKYDWLYTSTYWTSSPFGGSPSIVWRVQSDGKIGTSYANYNNNTGVRPVIVIKNNTTKTSK